MDQETLIKFKKGTSEEIESFKLDHGKPAVSYIKTISSGPQEGDVTREHWLYIGDNYIEGGHPIANANDSLTYSTEALQLATQAGKELEFEQKIRNISGVSTVYNRGVIWGAKITTKALEEQDGSTNTEDDHKTKIGPGSVFIRGRTFALNSEYIVYPDDRDGETQLPLPTHYTSHGGNCYVFVFLYIDQHDYDPEDTSHEPIDIVEEAIHLKEIVVDETWDGDYEDLGMPEDSILLHRWHVTNDTMELDSYSDYIDGDWIRETSLIEDDKGKFGRKETNYPKSYTHTPNVDIIFPKVDPLDNSKLVYPNGNYSVLFDVIGFDGSGFQVGTIFAEESKRNNDGFTIATNGSVDKLKIRWRLHHYGI